MIHIDADILTYRIGFACEEEPLKKATSQLDNLVASILVRCGRDASPYQLYLTGKGNFRFDFASIQPYKGTRVSAKPTHYHELRDHMMTEWGAVLVEGQEADDAIAIAATKDLDNALIVSTDKDFLQVPTNHYNFVKDEFQKVSEWEGLMSLYTQMLTGDRVDNIRGCVGIGKVKAAKALQYATTEEDLYNAVVTCYKGNEEELYENARLLFLRRYEEEWWVDPIRRKELFDDKNPIGEAPTLDIANTFTTEGTITIKPNAGTK
jgi:hypothetical protein